MIDSLSVNSCELWSRNIEQCVEARSVIVTLLWQYGMTDRQIASEYQITRQGVNKLRNACKMKMRKARVREAYSNGREVMLEALRKR